MFILSLTWPPPLHYSANSPDCTWFLSLSVLLVFPSLFALLSGPIGFVVGRGRRIFGGSATAAGCVLILLILVGAEIVIATNFDQKHSENGIGYFYLPKETMESVGKLQKKTC